MIILYAIFMFLLVTSFRIYKKENPILLGAIILLLLISGNKLQYLASEYVLMLLQLFNNSLFASAMTVLVLSYIVSELFWLLGFQKYFEQKVLNRGEKVQKLYILILAIFSTNITYSESALVKKNAALLNSNSFILSTLNIFSPIIILVNLLVIIVLGAGDESTIFLLYISNGIAFFWFGKGVIDIFTSRVLSFEIYAKRIISYQIAENDNSINYTKFKDVFIMTPLIFFITLFLGRNLLSVFMVIDITLVFLTILLFIKVIKYSYITNKISEKYIYSSILTTILRILNTMFIIINSSILVQLLISVFFDGIYLPRLTMDALLLVFMGYTIMILLYSKRYEFALITIFPVIHLLVNNGLLLRDAFLVCLIFAIILLFRQFSIVKFTHKLFVDYLFTALLIISSYVVLLVTTNLVYFYLALFLALLIYIIFNLLYKEKY